MDAMESTRTLLERFKNLEMTRAELETQLGKSLWKLKLDPLVAADTHDVIRLLEAYKRGESTLERLLEWVNTIWFVDDVYEYADHCVESMASVMTELEELDEPGHVLTPEAIDDMIDALRRNVDYLPDMQG